MIEEVDVANKFAWFEDSQCQSLAGRVMMNNSNIAFLNEVGVRVLYSRHTDMVISSERNDST